MSDPDLVLDSAGGRFEVQGRVGEGAMGIIYRAFDRERGITVAIKTLRRLDAAAIYAFKREFRTLCGLSHPNLIKLYELFSAGGNWFFTMELLEAVVDFLTFVRGERRDCLDEGRARDGLRQLTAGLTALHDAGKLHRDIKPSNVLVTAAGRVVLCDFGLAIDTEPRRFAEMTRSSAGTPSYMSPEQVRGHELSPASDWYSVGVMLHEALTGALPLPASALSGGHLPPDLADLSRRWLSRDPNDRPGGSDVLDILGNDDVSTVTESRALAPFVGRRHELARLETALAALGHNRPAVVRLHGSSGVGKSGLTRQFLDRVHHEGRGLVLEGRCYEQESVPYKALDTIIDALSRYLRHLDDDTAEALMPNHVVAMSQLFPVLRRVEAVSFPRTPIPHAADPNETRRRGVEGLKHLLAALSKTLPVVISIDDAQWGDRDSADLLQELLRGPDAPRLLLLISHRSDEVEASAFLRAFIAAHAESIELPLAPLDAEATAELAALLVDHGDATVLGAVARESEGNPFLVAELARYVNAGGGPGQSVSAVDITMEGVVARRIGKLEPVAAQVLTTLAIAGHPVSPARVKRVVGDTPGVEAAFVALRAHHLMRSRGASDRDLIECYHDRIRETVVAELPAAQRRSWHERWATVLEQDNDRNRDALALHFARAGRDERAAHYAILAAKQASDAFAFDRAVELYRWALQLRPVVGRAALQLRERLGTALARAGRGAEAAAEFLLAAHDGAVEDVMSLRLCAAEQLLRAGHLDQGARLLADVLHQLGMRISASPRRALLAVLALRARIRLRGLNFDPQPRDRIDPELQRKIDACWAVSAGLSMVDTMRGMEFQSRHLLLSLRAGDERNISRAFALEAMFRCVVGPRAAAKSAQLLDRAAQQGADDAACVGLVHAGRALRAFQLGEFSAALGSADQALETFHTHCVGATWEVDSVSLFAMWSLYYLGDWHEMTRRVVALRQHARDRGDLFGETSLSIGLPSLSWLVEDRAEHGREVGDEVMSRWSRRGFHLQHYWYWIGQCQTDAYVGDGVRAVARARDIWSALRRSFFLQIQAVRIEANDMRARAALIAARQHPAHARRYLAEATRAARRLCSEPLPWAHACGNLVRAAIADTRGEPARALYAAAEQLANEAHMSMYAAAARWRRGQRSPGAEGDALMASAEIAFRGQGVREPARIAALLAPPAR